MKSSHASPPDPLRRGVVRLFTRTAAGDTTLGTGFLAHSSGLVVTCAHVFGKGLTFPIQKPPVVHAQFLATGEVATARILSDHTRPPMDEDIAVLKLENAHGAGVDALPLGMSVHYDVSGPLIRLRTYGYPQAKGAEGMPGGCELVGAGTENGHPVWTVRSNEVTHGFSGGPVWDDLLGAVVGVNVSVMKMDAVGKLALTAFFIPIETVRAVCPELALPEGNPYKGLNCFDEQDHASYFGRESTSDRLEELLRVADFVSVVGVSGSGKSSLVRAGLQKSAEKKDHWLGGWRRRVFKAGSSPLISLLESLEVSPSSLAAAVAGGVGPSQAVGKISSAGTGMPRMEDEMLKADPVTIATCLQAQITQRTILVCDQFERIYTDCKDEAHRALFCAVLTAAASENLKVVMALRADFYAKVLDDPLVGVKVRSAQVTLGPMTAGELRAAIIQPARRLFRHLQPSLVDALVGEVQTRASDLPLLQFVLEELWTKDRAKGVLTYASYEELEAPSAASGTRECGLRGGIIRRAEAYYNELGSDTQRKLFCDLFLRLVAPRSTLDTTLDTTRDISRRALESELAPEELALANKLAETFLLTTNYDPLTKVRTFEVAHEVLIRSWPRLQKLVEDNAEWARWNDQVLVPEFTAWLRARRLDSYLIPAGPVLEEAARWLSHPGQRLEGGVLEFVRKSITVAAAQLADRKEEKRKRRRLRGGIWCLASVAVVIALLLLQSTSQSRVVLARDFLQRGILALQAHNHLEAAILFAKSITLDDRIEARERLVESLGSGTRLQSFCKIPGNTVAIGEDGTSLLVYRDNASIQMVESTTGELSSDVIYQDTRAGITFAAASPSGQWLAWESHPLNRGAEGEGTQNPGNAFHVYNTFTHRMHPSTPVEHLVLAVAIHEPSQTVAFGDNYGNIRLFHLSTMQERSVKLKHGQDNKRGKVFGLAFSPDGNWLASAGSDYEVNLWDLRTAAQTVLKGHTDVVYSTAFSPDGKLLASGSSDSTVRLWDLVHLTSSSRVLSGDQGLMNELTFDKDGYLLAGCGEDQSVRIWDVHSGREIHKLQAYEGSIRRLKFSPDGKIITAAGEDGWCRRWTLADALVMRSLQNDKTPTSSVCFSDDGSLVYSGDQSGRIRQFSLTSTELPKTLFSCASRVLAVALHPQHPLLVCGGEDNLIHIFDLDTLQEREPLSLERFEGSGEAHQQVFRIAFDAAGGRMAFATLDGSVQVFKVDAARQFEKERVFRTNPPKSIFNVGFGGAPGTFASVGSADLLHLWNTENATPVRALSGHAGAIWALDWSGDGAAIATGSEDSEIRLWDAASGETTKILQGHSATVLSLAYGRPQSWLASGANDHTTRLWHLGDGRKLVLRCSSGPVWWVDFSKDSSHLATCGLDGAIRVWNVDSIDRLLIQAPEEAYRLIQARSGLAINEAHQITVSPTVPTSAESPPLYSPQ